MSEVLSSLHTCLFYAKDAWVPEYTYWDKESMYIRKHSEKNMSDSDFRAPLYASYSLSYYMTNTSVSQMITTCIVLPVDTLEGNWVENEKAAFSIKYQFVYTFWGKSIFDALSLSGQTASFSCSPEFFNQKCAEFSSEFNGTIGRFLWWILKKLEPFKCPKVWKYQKIHFETEWVK